MSTFVSRAPSALLSLAFLVACSGELDSPPDASVRDGGTPRDGGQIPDAGTTTAAIALFAGSHGGIGNLDGPRRDARFSGPSGVARAQDGTVYVADTSNYVIRKISPQGEVTTLAGRPGVPGTADGIGADARFQLPASIALTPSGSLIVSDAAAGTLRHVTHNGVVTTFAGRPGQHATVDGHRDAARFRSPEGLAFDGDVLYVVDRDAHTVRRIEDDQVTTLAGADQVPGSADGALAEARFTAPFGVAAADGLVAVADSGNNTIRLIADGVVSTLAGTPGAPQGTTDGAGPNARFGGPRDLAFLDENLLVADTFNDRLRLVSPEGVVTTWTGSTAGSRDGLLAHATISFPSGLAIGDDGAIYVGDTVSSIVRRIADGTVSTYAGTAVELEHKDGPGDEARFFGAGGMLARNDGSMFVADTYNHAIRRVAADGTVTTVAGRADKPGNTDGPLATARFDGPRHLADDGAGGWFISDANNFTIRHVDADGEVTTFAGGPVGRGQTYVDGWRLDARFASPAGLALDSQGALFIADAGNHVIRRIGTDGIVTTVAGVGLPGHADGDAEEARFNGPDAIVLADDDTLLVADALNSVIRRVDLSNGTVETLAGHLPVDDEARPGANDGIGASAGFSTPRGLTLVDGVLYVADTNNSLVRRVNLETRRVTTVAGTRGQHGLRPGALPGVLFEPWGIAVMGDDAYVTHFGGVVRIGGMVD